MILENTMREKNANQSRLDRVPYQPEVISKCNQIVLDKVPKLKKQILEAQDDLQRMLDIEIDYKDKDTTSIMLILE